LKIFVIDIYNKSSLAKVCEQGRDGLMFMYAHVHDEALCGNTVRNVTLDL